MEIVGYTVSLFIGLALGLMGAGGGVLTVPTMVYLFHVPTILATSYSLFIVGITSLFAAIHKYRQGEVRFGLAILFSLISVSVVSIIRKWVIPSIPGELFVNKKIAIDSSALGMAIFSMLMIWTSYTLIKKRKATANQPKPLKAFPRLIWTGIFVGIVTGLLGAGGGFLLVPSFVLLLDLEIKEAIGTSLVVITMNSLFGFAMDLNHTQLDWKFLIGITIIASIGVIIGLIIGRKMSGARLKIVFGWFIMVVGISILASEIYNFFQKIKLGS